MLLKQLARLMGKSHAVLLHHYLLRVCSYCLVQGLTFVLVVPIIHALLDSQWDVAMLWLLPLGTGVILTGYLHYRAAQSGFQVAVTLMNQLRRRMGDHVITLPLGWFVRANTNHVGVLLRQGVMALLGLPAHQLTPLLRAVLTPSVVVVATSFFDWCVALCAAFLFPMLGLVYWWAGRMGRGVDPVVRGRNAVGCEGDGRLAQTHTRSPHHNKGMRRARHSKHRYTGNATRYPRWHLFGRMLMDSWLGQLILLILVLCVTWFVVIEGDTAQQTTLLALLVLVSRVIDPLSEMASYDSGIRMTSPRRYATEETPAPLSLSAPTDPVPLPRQYAIAFRDVTFCYQPGVPILKSVSMILPANSMTAVVDESGSGGSALIKLIARFFDPESDAITIGGIDVKAFPVVQHMGMISLVPRENTLFSGTLRENLLIGNPFANDATLQKVVQLARLESVVQRLPRGMDSMVGEEGERLSCGERQRTALAQALLKRAPILLLDETTDTRESEHQDAIIQGIAALRGRCTILVVAQQLNTLRHADHILVLADGHIVEQGNHQQLLNANGRYAAFLQKKMCAEV